MKYIIEKITAQQIPYYETNASNDLINKAFEDDNAIIEEVAGFNDLSEAEKYFSTLSESIEVYSNGRLCDVEFYSLYENEYEENEDGNEELIGQIPLKHTARR